MIAPFKRGFYKNIFFYSNTLKSSKKHVNKIKFNNFYDEIQFQRHLKSRNYQCQTLKE